ncbi:MAG TPA: hypothetical protein VK629_17210 [Steroidobacteraceae bacterium]|nr:hypothetical protein [Steroidobacteraceae bacterium]
MRNWISTGLNRDKQRGKIGYILAWALGVPIPILFLVFLVRGCN